MAVRKVAVSARNATLHNANGSIHTDLFVTNATLLLGPGNNAIVRAQAQQNEKVWTGRLDTDTRLRAIEVIEQLIPLATRGPAKLQKGIKNA